MGDGDGLEARPEELAAAAARVAAAADRVQGAARDLVDALHAAAGAMPGPASARACEELAGRWASRATGLAAGLSHFGGSLRATATDLAATDVGLAVGTPDAP